MRFHRAVFGRSRICIALLSFFFASCVPLTPLLCDPATAKPDERLFGAWSFVNQDRDDSTFWISFIGKTSDSNTPPGIMTLLQVSSFNDGRVKVEKSLNLVTFTLGKHHFANLFQAEPGNAEKKENDAAVNDCLLVKYSIEDDRLVVWPMDQGAAETAIEHGKVKGTVEQKGPLKLTHVRFTDAEGLKQYLKEAGGDSLFADTKPLVHTRVR